MRKRRTQTQSPRSLYLSPKDSTSPILSIFSATLSLPLSTAPSTVPIMHQVSATMRSITLSWPQPEQPNGIILDYEIRYYEKVSHLWPQTSKAKSTMFSGCDQWRSQEDRLEDHREEELGAGRQWIPGEKAGSALPRFFSLTWEGAFRFIIW